MPENRLLENAANPNNATGGGFDAFTYGNTFRVTATRYAVEIGWYRTAIPAEQRTPNRLAIWNRGTGAVLYEVGAVPDDGNIGWQRQAIALNVALTPGIDYVVAVSYTAGGGHPFRVASPAVAAPFTAHVPFVSFGANGSIGAPTAGFDADPELIGADVGVDTIGPDPAGTGDPALTGDLASWLSSDADLNEHQADGLPWLTKAALDDGTNGLAAIKGAVNTANTRIGSLAGLDFASLAAGIAELWTRTATLVAASAELIARVPDTVGDSIASLLGTLTGNEGSAVGALSGRSGFPTELWTMVDEVDFVQAKSWDVPADLYTLSTLAWPVSIRQTLVDGAPWRPRLGWWAVRNGDLIGARRFIDWENSFLEDGGRRMPGIVVWLEPSTAGTLQAWRLT